MGWVENSRWLSYDLILVYKILHGLTPSTLFNNLILQEFTQTPRGHSYKLVKSRCSHDICKYFFPNCIVDLWNSLPNEVVSVQLLQAFKYKVFHLNLWMFHGYISVFGFEFVFFCTDDVFSFEAYTTV